jgi:hypothetical protein
MQALQSATVAGTILNAGGQFAEGAFARDMARAQATAYGQMGHNAVGAAQGEAAGIRRDTKRLQSRARAVAASSGGASTDAGVQNVIGDIGQQGEYNAMAALYEGQEAQHIYNTRAAMAKAQGKADFRTGALRGATTIMAGTKSLYDKYGVI